MSHLKERTEKNCLNCNAIVHGRYCSVCGQENLEPQEGVGHLLSHFFNDITHFDGKFFSSMKYLIFKPGFLSEEYMLGRRSSYLNPIRMYIFTSAIFFLIFFSFLAPEETTYIPRLQLANKADSSKAIQSLKEAGIDTSMLTLKRKPERSNFEFDLGADDKRYKNVEEYDSLVKAGIVKHNFIMRYFMRKSFYLKKKYGDNANAGEKLKETMQHYLPHMLFLSLPLFALFLKLIYIRRKKFYYVAHGIFTIHYYVFLYLMLLLIVALTTLYERSGSGIIVWLIVPLYLALFYYGYKAMRNFYGQGRFKTILKYLLLHIWLIVILITLSLGLFFFSFYKL